MNTHHGVGTPSNSAQPPEPVSPASTGDTDRTDLTAPGHPGGAREWDPRPPRLAKNAQGDVETARGSDEKSPKPSPKNVPSPKAGSASASWWGQLMKKSKLEGSGGGGGGRGRSGGLPPLSPPLSPPSDAAAPRSNANHPEFPAAVSGTGKVSSTAGAGGGGGLRSKLEAIKAAKAAEAAAAAAAATANNPLMDDALPSPGGVRSSSEVEAHTGEALPPSFGASGARHHRRGSSVESATAAMTANNPLFTARGNPLVDLSEPTETTTTEAPLVDLGVGSFVAGPSSTSALHATEITLVDLDAPADNGQA